MTDRQVSMIKAMNTTFSTEYILEKAKEFEEYVKRIRSSNIDLSQIKIVPKEEK